uniref:Uncharacterized protein n=1 Tax=Helianthus annuus TaxID=4232 RepID=A0A251TJG0_HELAN
MITKSRGSRGILTLDKLDGGLGKEAGQTDRIRGKEHNPDTRNKYRLNVDIAIT